MNNANQRIADLARRFVDELQAIARDELLEMLGGQAGGRGSKTRATSGRGAKRSSEALESLKRTFADHVSRHPGLRIEEINKALNTTTSELALPIRKLIAEGAVTAKGQKRSTKYFPGGGRGKSKPRRKSKR